MPAPSTEPPGACPDADSLRRVAFGDAPDRVANGIAVHLDACPACQSRFESLLAAAGPGIPEKPDSAEPSPSLVGLLNRLRSAGPGGQVGPADGEIEDAGVLLGSTAPDALGSFAGYQVLERIASGGMGVVYRARDEGLNRTIALKVLAPALAANRGARERFLREARAAAAVVNEFVVAIHAVGEERGLPYLVMEFVQGRTLEARLRQGPAELPEMLRLGAQIGRGLAAAHARGLVHRDVKPANVLLERGSDRVRLTDFGLARAVDDPGLTRVGVVAGTPEYMSPEQARGERVDGRSDLFSLGTVLHALATGRSPFRADSTAATLKRVCEDRPERVDRLDPALPRWFGEVVSRLLAKRPDERFASAGELADLLEERLRCLGGSSESPAKAERDTRGEAAASTRSATSRRRRVLAGLIVGATLAATAMWLVRQRPMVDPRAPDRPRFGLLRTNGSIGGFRDLAAAVAAAGPGEIIELAYDGSEECAPLAIRGKALTLRARPPFRPVLVARTDAQTLLATDSPLVLEDLEIRAPGPGSDTRSLVPELQSPSSAVSRWVTDAMFARMDTGQASPALVDVRSAELVARRCRFVTSAGAGRAWDALVLVHPRQARVADCEFYDLGGFALRVRVIPRGDAGAIEVPHVEVTNCLFFASQPVFVGAPAGVRARVGLSRSTFVGLRLCNLRPSAAVDLEAADCLIAVGHLFAFGPEDAIPAGSTWRERRNLFADPTGAANFANRLGPLAGPESRVIAFEVARRIRESSRTGPLTAADFRATDGELRRPGDTDSTACGCQPESVGPGSDGRAR